MSFQSRITQLATVALAISCALPSIASANETFGSKGQIVPSGTLSYDYHQSQSPFGETSDHRSTSTSNTLAVSPEISYFVSDNLSLGMGLVFVVAEQEYVTSSDLGGLDSESSLGGLGGLNYDTTTVVLGLSPSVGYNVNIADDWSFFPRASVSLNARMGSGAFGNESIYTANLSVTAPILYHPTSHFFIGFGPVWGTQIATSQELPQQPEGYESTSIQFQSTVGGWF